MKCKMSCWSVPEDPFAATSRAVSSCRCETHSWQFQIGATISIGTLCPLGRIEQAVEDGIERINQQIKP